MGHSQPPNSTRRIICCCLCCCCCNVSGERPAAFKAAAKRGELVAAVRNRDVATVKALLQECSLPLVWTCEGDVVATAAANTQAPVAGAAAAAGAVQIGAGVQAGLGVQGLQNPGHAKPRESCLLNLLKTAAAAGPPESVLLLRLLLPALPASRTPQRNQILALFMKFCLEWGLVDELEVVLAVCGRGARARGQLLRQVAGYLQLPEDNSYLGHLPGTDSGSPAAAAAAVPGPIAAAVAVMHQSGSTDMLSLYVTHPYMQLISVDPYLRATSRPAFAPSFMPCKKGLTLLFIQLTKLDQLPASAKVNDVSLYGLMVMVVTQASDVGLLHAFLCFMDKHGESLLADVVGRLDAPVVLTHVE